MRLILKLFAVVLCLVAVVTLVIMISSASDGTSLAHRLQVMALSVAGIAIAVAIHLGVRRMETHS